MFLNCYYWQRFWLNNFLLIDKAKKAGKERTQTAELRNQKKRELTLGGGVEPLTHFWSQDMRTAVSYLPPSCTIHACQQ